MNVYRPCVNDRSCRAPAYYYCHSRLSMSTFLRCWVPSSLYVAIIVFIIVAQGARAGAADEAAKLQTFSVAKNGQPIIVPVRIGGIEYRFLLDTGSSVTLFSSSLKHLLGKATRSRKVASQFDGTGKKEMCFQAPRLSLADIPLGGVREVLCCDDAVFSEAHKATAGDGQPIQGALGVDAIRALILRIDFDRGELSILPSVPRDSGEEFVIQYILKVPCARFQGPDGFPELFILDTGFISPIEGSLRCLQFRARLDAGGITLLDDALIKLYRGQQRLRRGRVDRFRFGPFVHRDLLFLEGSHDSVSLRYLSRYVVTFDFPRDRLHLFRGRQFDADSEKRLGSEQKGETENGETENETDNEEKPH